MEKKKTPESPLFQATLKSYLAYIEADTETPEDMRTLEMAAIEALAELERSEGPHTVERLENGVRVWLDTKCDRCRHLSRRYETIITERLNQIQHEHPGITRGGALSIYYSKREESEH